MPTEPTGRCTGAVLPSAPRETERCRDRTDDTASKPPLDSRAPAEQSLSFSFPGSSRRSEEHTSELQSLMRISYAVFCLKKQTPHTTHKTTINQNAYQT